MFATTFGTSVWFVDKIGDLWEQSESETGLDMHIHLLREV